MTELLSTRCERAGPDEQPALLIELVRHVAPEPPWKGSDNQEYTTWYQRWCQPFNALLAIGTDPAYLAAALMITEGLSWSVGFDGGATVFHRSGAMFRVCGCKTPALALCASVARSRGL